MTGRPDLPTGTVTFLFTDVEGSTRLLTQLGAAGYADALGSHRGIVRRIAADQGGVEVDTAGDAFFIAFPTAPGAVAAAAAISGSLGAGPIRLRMGIHTGTPTLTDEGYVGEDVHRAARIAAAGHGGQVLISAATAALIGSEDLRDLGDHRLKDLASPERIYQVGGEDFPPLRSLFQTNLPIPATPFLGREQELAEVLGMLARPEVRLLTLTGPGGTGKTRLCIQAAALDASGYPDGTWWVPLAPIRDPRLVTSAIAGAIGARESPTDHIAARRMMLVLDNFEQVTAAAEDVAGILAACPNVRVLVTSRERLAIPGEHLYPVPPLAPPEGAALFAIRARAIDPTFVPDDSVQALCDRLDNLPLAIELAASRIGTLTLPQLHERLGRRLDLLKGGRGLDERQRTIRAAIEWSHDLLSAEEQRLFADLSVFRGGFTLDAAERVVDADLNTLGSLVDKSLVRRSDHRFAMLETIAEFATERLEALGDPGAARRRHAEWVLALTESANLAVESISRGPQRHDLVRPEFDNVRAALDWATDADHELGIRIAVSLENLWATGEIAEGRRRLEELLPRSGDIDPLLRVRALRVSAGTSEVSGEYERAGAVYAEALELAREIDDPAMVALLTFRLGNIAMHAGEVERGRELWLASLDAWVRIGDKVGELQALGNLGAWEVEQGDVAAGRTMIERSLVLAREVGWTWWEAMQLQNLADLEIQFGDLDTAEGYAGEAMALARDKGDRPGLAAGLLIIAWIAARRGDADRASLLARAVEAEDRRAPMGWGHARDWYRTQIGPVEANGPTLPFDEAVEMVMAASDVLVIDPSSGERITGRRHAHGR